MNFIKFLFIFSALYITLAQCSVIIKDDDGDDNVIVVVPTAAMKIIQAVVNVATNFGISAIQGVSSSVAIIEKEMNNLEQGLVDRLWTFVADRLDEIEIDASRFTKIAIECIKTQSDELKGVVFNFSSESVTCEIEKIVMTLETYLPMLTDVRDTNEKMKDFIEQLDNCGNDAAAVACIDKVSDEMEKELNELLDTVKEDLAEAAVLQENYERFANLCRQDATSTLEEKSKKAGTTVSECIEQNFLNITSV